ncbi:MAG: hypothetical protein M3Z04_20395 [Chloroflexota bacterium]|nr:hypothetical protein [Chloroflexota bacterium]
MRYHSIDQFLTTQQPALAGLMAAAQRTAGGHYAAMTPIQLQQTAANDAEQLIAALRNSPLPRESFQENARAVDGNGVALDDLTRLADAVEAQIIPYFSEQLQDEPDLRDELLRRFRYINGRFRAGIRAVQIDKTIRRLQP